MTTPKNKTWFTKLILDSLGAFGLLGLLIGSAPAQAAGIPAGLPLYFEANQGRADSTAQFIARGQDSQFLISPAGAQVVLSKAASNPVTLQMQFVGANPQAQIRGDAELTGKINYLTGSDSAQWKTGVPTFAKVRVEDIYPGIGLVYYGNHRQLEYDFTIAPGANPDAIAIHFNGANNVTIGSGGELILDLGNGEIRQPKPLIYQMVNGVREAVNGGYRMADAGTVAFSIGTYDHRLPLVIDPVLSYSTYFGGNVNDTAWAVAVDTNGFVYIAGQTTSTQFAPGKSFATPGALQTNFQGGTITGDAFVAKLDNAGTNLIYLTYLGGSGDDEIYGLVVDANGNAYIAGATDSPNFPVKNAIYTNISGTINPFSHSYLADAFIAELNPGGSNLVYSTYLGGAGSDAAEGLALDSVGDAYVTGFTYSTNFPTTANAFQKKLGVTNWLYQAYYNGNAFVTEVAAGGSNLIYSSYFGGTNLDQGKGIAVDNANCVYIAGYTASVNFPNTNSFQTNLNGATNQTSSFDSFVAKFAPSCTNLVYSTFLGGTNNDVANHLAVDGLGNAYVTGWTVSANFPDTATNVPGLYNGLTNNLVNGFTVTTNAFLTQVTWNGTNAAIGYSAVFGGTNFGVDIGYGVAVDAAGDAFVVGATSSTNFPSTLPANGIGQLIATNAGASDVFVTAFNPSATALLYSVDFGGANNDYGYAIALDASTNAYIVGQTTSANFPTNNARQAALNGSSDAFLAKIILNVLLPTITTQPASQTNVSGSFITFAAAATGTPPLTYQWQIQETNLTWTNLVNGGGIGGATNATLTIANALTASSGNYQLVVNNYGGSATSSLAVLTITNAPVALTQQPNSLTNGVGTTNIFAVYGNGTEVSFQWFKDGVPLVDKTNTSGSIITGSTNNVITIKNSQTNDIGNYSVIVSNSVNSVTSSNAFLDIVIPPTILIPPAGQTVVSGTFLNIAVSAVGQGTLHYRWQVQPTNLLVWMDVTNRGNISGATNAVLSFGPAFTTNSGNYQVIISNNFGSVTSSVVLLTVTNIPVALNSQPANQTNGVAATTVFTVAVQQGTEYSVQWLKNGAALANGATGSGSVITNANALQLTILNTQTNDIGNYSVMVSNSVNSVISSSAFLDVVTLPIIFTQPTSQTVVSATSLNIAVTAVGGVPLHYRWQVQPTNLLVWMDVTNRANVGGSTNSTLSFGPAYTTNSGNYQVIITNNFGSVTSAVALLTVTNAPVVLTQQPASQTNGVGATTTFVASAQGTELSIQWLKNGVALTNGATGSGSVISNANNFPLTIRNTQTNDIGLYSVMVSNSVNSVTSSNAFLAVVTVPTILVQPTNQFAGVNFAATLAVTAVGTAPLSYQWQVQETNLTWTNLVDGNGISGTTNNTLIFSSAQVTNSGNYQVVITNLAGSVTSSNAVLTVTNVATVLTEQPASQTVGVGSTVTFSVGGTAQAPFFLQWVKDGTNLVDMTNSSGSVITGSTDDPLTIANVQVSDAGVYWLVISNTWGVLASSNAVLTVLTAPRFTSVISVGGTNFTFSGAGGTNGGTYSVLTTTNLAWPLTNWVNRGSKHFDSQGNFNFDYSVTNALPHEFLILQMP